MKAPTKIEFTTRIKNGKWVNNTKELFCFNQAWENCEITVTLHKKTNKRSNNQNAYYFGCIIPIFQKAILNEWDEFWSKNDCHEFLLANFNYDELVDDNTGEILRKVRRSKQNNTVQAEAFYKKCRDFLYEYFNVIAPMPNEATKLDF